MLMSTHTSTCCEDQRDVQGTIPMIVSLLRWVCLHLTYCLPVASVFRPEYFCVDEVTTRVEATHLQEESVLRFSVDYLIHPPVSREFRRPH